MNCDVLVLGGGGAGLAAAVTAAKCGARVVLVERHGALGGMATAALVHSVCGLYRLREEPGAVLAHAGFPAEFSRRLIAAGAARGPVRMGRMDVLPHSPPGFAAVADAVARECPSLTVLFHTEVCSVTRDAARIAEVTAVCRGKAISIFPAAVVDASGDAVAATLAGADTEMVEPSRLQRPAFIFAMHGADAAMLNDDGRLRVARTIAEGVARGALDAGALGAQFRVTGRGTEVYATVDLAGPLDYDPTSPAHLTHLEVRGRSLAVELLRFLRAECPAFSNAEIAAFPARVGVRESRRVRGVQSVTADDVLRGTAKSDAVALGTWPMESRERATGPRWRFPEGLRPTQIPLGALRAAALENLWVAGRCISCEHEAQAALRVIGTCMATGQAAGAAAAMQAEKSVAPTAANVRTVIGMEAPE